MDPSDRIAPAAQPSEKHEAGKIRRRRLGHVRLRQVGTNELILIPTPSDDPNDPLNWPQWYKYYMAVVVCTAMMICNFLAAGPTITIVTTTLDFFPGATPDGDPAGFNVNVAKVAYFFTSTALVQGLGNFFWVPMANKYGRRPVYILSYIVYTAVAVWLIFEKSYAGFLVGRIILGFGSGAAETIAPISIADVFFLHERGTIMALYTSFLSVGVAFGILISGLITINHEWRVIYQVAAALVGFVLLLAFFTFPETAYVRDTDALACPSIKTSPEKMDDGLDVERAPTPTASRPPVSKKESYLASLRIFHKVLTNESLAKLALRPLGLICLPPVLWAALVQSVTIGFLVAVTSNVDPGFQKAYGFESYQVGLCFIAAIIGSILGIFAGGHFSDWVADYFTKRNGGVRDPEMRLPAMVPCLIATPLSLILYGVGIHYKLHWICPTIGLGLLNFAIAQGTNVCLVYVIDGYRPVAGEITLAVMGFKSLFGFLLSFYTNPWVAQSGYRSAYGSMAGIATLVILMWVPLYLYGKQIRHTTWHWRIMSSVHWNDDREVGE